MAQLQHPHPVVTPLSPSHSLSTAHHVPSSRMALSTIEGKPAYFQNPWKSYRAPSLNDAWLAYQKGAAIALPPSKTPAPASLARARNNGDGEGDELTPLAVEPDVEGAGEIIVDDPRDGTGAIRAKGRGMLGRVYVRPEFAYLGDEEEWNEWRDPPVEVVEPSWEESQGGDVTWLGHASVLVRIPWKRVDGKNRAGSCGVLFDPIFSYRCSPTQYVGPARYLPPPCTVQDLPPIHICCISHDHYDHLDYYTIMDLWKHHQQTIHFFVPLGLKAWFVASGITDSRVTELDWFHESLISFPSSSSYSSSSAPSTPASPYSDIATSPFVDPKSALTVKLAFTPAQHRSGRGVLDHMTTLWGSWCLGLVEDVDADRANKTGMRDWKGFNMFFGGDTGYRYATAAEDDPDAICPAFQEIASLYSPFDLTMLPLSTGSSLPFLRTILSLSLDQYTLTSSQHCSPEDALEIHRILKAKRSLGIHWGTFCDADEARGTRVSFARGRRKLGVGKVWDGEDASDVGEKGRFVVSDIGETLKL